MSNWVVVPTDSDYLMHHGIMGQKWGKKNGPPYPLDEAVSTGKRLKKAEQYRTKQIESKTREVERSKTLAAKSNDVVNRNKWNRYVEIGKKEIETLKGMSLEELEEDKKRGARVTKHLIAGGVIGGLIAGPIGAAGGIAAVAGAKKIGNKPAINAEARSDYRRALAENKKTSSRSTSKDSYEDMFSKNLKKIRNDSKTKAAFRNYVKENYPDRNLSEINDDRLDAMMDDYAEYLTDRQYYKK